MQETTISNEASEQGARTRALRFLGVTVLTAALGQILILAFFAGLGWPAVVANAVAVVAVMVVGFALSITFVWVDSNPADRRTQIVAFILLGLVGLVLSTAMVGLVTSRLDHVLAANIGSFAGYGVAWVLRFLVLDRYIFQRSDLITEHAMTKE